MKDTLHKESIGDRVSDAFTKVAFAESGELYPEHPHRLHSMTEVFMEVSFAESGEQLTVPFEKTEPPKVCSDGETAGGLCV